MRDCVPNMGLSTFLGIPMDAIDISTYDLRVMELAKKICNLYTYPELERLAPISPQTIQRWADGKHRSSKSTASALPKIIAVSDEDYNKYLEGDITLDELWQLKGTAKRISAKQAITAQSVLQDAKRLPTQEQFRLMSNLFLNLIPQDGEEMTLTKKKPELVELDEMAKKRLKNLLDMSNIYLQQTYQSIIEAGADKVLIEDMVEGFHNQYILDAYETLLPFVCLCTEWRDVVPDNANPARYFNSAQHLIDSLHQR